MENKISTFTDLKTWQKAHQLVLYIYKFTKSFPKEEKYSLTDQVRRSATSITSNIAEGFSRKTIKDKQNFYHISMGSLSELQNQLIIAKDLNYLPTESYEKVNENCIEVGKLLRGLIKSTAKLKY